MPKDRLRNDGYASVLNSTSSLIPFLCSLPKRNTFIAFLIFTFINRFLHKDVPFILRITNKKYESGPSQISFEISIGRLNQRYKRAKLKEGTFLSSLSLSRGYSFALMYPLQDIEMTPQAAFEHIYWSHGHPFLLAHCRILRWGTRMFIPRAFICYPQLPTTRIFRSKPLQRIFICLCLAALLHAALGTGHPWSFSRIKAVSCPCFVTPVHMSSLKARSKYPRWYNYSKMSTRPCYAALLVPCSYRRGLVYITTKAFWLGSLHFLFEFFTVV
jgi:hypothetical protein